MGKRLKVLYDCMKCHSYCCTYPRIQVTKRDVRRLARHFGIPEERARERFTKQGATKRERVLRHQLDDVYGSACRFLDLDTRLCTVHDARPDACRGYPEERRCGYYEFMMYEREHQDDPEMEVRAYNLPGEWRNL